MTQNDGLNVVIALLREPMTDADRQECVRTLEGIAVQVRRLERLVDDVVADAMQDAREPAMTGVVLPFLGRRREMRQ